MFTLFKKKFYLAVNGLITYKTNIYLIAEHTDFIKYFLKELD